MGEDFMRTFSTCFAVLGLKLLFGSKQVTIGSVVLLGAISGTIASAWTGGGAEWVELNIGSVVNSTMIGTGPDFARKVVCASGGRWAEAVPFCATFGGGSTVE